MALAIRNKKVITIVPPRRISKEERKFLESLKLNEKLIKRATSRRYNIVRA